MKRESVVYVNQRFKIERRSQEPLSALFNIESITNARTLRSLYTV